MFRKIMIGHGCLLALLGPGVYVTALPTFWGMAWGKEPSHAPANLLSRYLRKLFKDYLGNDHYELNLLDGAVNFESRH